MAALTQFIAALTPAPFVNPQEYDGFEVNYPPCLANRGLTSLAALEILCF